MTRKDLEKAIQRIENEVFHTDSVNPILVGARRARFDSQRFARMVELAQKGQKWKSVRSKLSVWNRQLDRARKREAYFEAMRMGTT